MTCLVVFGEDFGRHPHCLEHLIRHMPVTVDILWVETAGLRGPKLTTSDFKRSIQKIAGWFNTSNSPLPGVETSIPNNIKIIRPFSLPWWGNSLVRLLNRWSVLRTIKQNLNISNKSSKKIDAIITSLPNTDIFLKTLREAKSIYYCVDEFKLWPGLPTRQIEELENKLLQKSDLVLCTSAHLLKTRKQLNPNCLLFTHGVDIEHFRLPPPNKISKVIFGYYGLIDERCDQNLLSTVAHQCPDAEIHIWGKATVDIGLLKKYNNIILHGEVNYQQLPTEISIVHIFLLPYVINEQTQTIYPLKIKEYLITGRPVVCTSLPDMPSLLPFVKIANSSEQFVQMCQNIISENNYYSSAQIDFFAQNESWKNKATQILNIIDQ